MNSLRIIASLASLLAIAPALFAATEEQFDRRFTVPAAAQLVVDVDFGGIEVVTNATSQVVIDVFRKVSTNSEKKEKEFLAERPLTFEQEGSKVIVRARKPGRVGGMWRWGKIKLEGRYRISVPADCQVDLTTAGGHIHVSGILAEVKAETSGGSLRFSGIKGAIQGDTAGGSISVIDCDGSIKVDTRGGLIEVKGGSGTLKADTAGGSIRVIRFAGPANVDTSGGSIVLEGITGKIVGSTSGGSISAILVGPELPGAVDLSTSGGSVSVTVPDGTALTLDAETSSGGVRSEIPVESVGKPKRNELSGAVNGGGPAVRLRTSGGSISVKKGMVSVR